MIIVSTQKEKQDKILINHEKIHLRQQWEMLILPFFVWYITEYIINRIKGMENRAAYRAISFEREAKENEQNQDYLKYRRPLTVDDFLLKNVFFLINLDKF